MSATKESTLVKAIATAIEEAYPEAAVYKIHGGPYQTAGIPDLLCCVRGRMIGLEVKLQRPGESDAHARSRATRLQLLEIDAINRAGGYAAVVLSVAEALNAVRFALPRM